MSTPVPTNWKPAETPIEALEYGLNLIEVEKRWTTGTLVQAPLHDYEAYEDEEMPPSIPPTCDNVKCCALGALALSVWDGQLIDLQLGGKNFRLSDFLPEADGWDSPLPDEDMAGDDDFIYAAIAQHPVTRKAAHFLVKAIKEIDTHLQYRMASGTENTNFIIEFNDQANLQPEVHLNKIIAAFRRAIELARADEAAPKDNPTIQGE